VADKAKKLEREAAKDALKRTMAYRLIGGAAYGRCRGLATIQLVAKAMPAEEARLELEMVRELYQGIMALQGHQPARGSGGQQPVFAPEEIENLLAEGGLSASAIDVEKIAALRDSVAKTIRS
jgi:hypothetical protein